MGARRLIATAAAVFLVTGGTAGADTLKVKNTHDHGKGSLRRALERANFGDRVEVPAGHYVLTTGELLADTEVNIVGAGARKTVLDANGDSRVLRISYSAPGTVRITGLTVREGDTDATEDGGGISVDSAQTKLLLTRVAVLDNRVINSSGFSSGGGVSSRGDVVIRQSLFAGNHGYNGGAVAATGLIKATDSTFFNNFGGNPTFNGDGGAFDDEVELTDSTVVGNQCFNDDGCGGGFAGSLATLKGTIVAENMAFSANGQPPGSPGNKGTHDNCGGGLVISMGHNLDDHNDCGLSGLGDLTRKNPKLGSLAFNGGPTKTLAIGANSPALNAGTGNCTPRDQRGVKRPQGPRCDIGAFELAR